VLLTYSKIRLGVLLCKISEFLLEPWGTRENCTGEGGCEKRVVGTDADLIVSDDIEEGNDIRSTAEDLKDFDFSLDFLFLDRFQDLDDTFFIVCDVDSFEYLRVLTSSNLPHNLIVIRVPEISPCAKATQTYEQQQIQYIEGR